MVFELSLLMTFLLVVIVLVIIAFFWWGIKHAIALAVNSVIGFFALYAIQAFLLSELIINIWSVLLTAVLGLIGLILVVVLHLFGVWF